MEYLRISNQGELDPIGLSLMGASAKSSNESIGR
jgi:hypothetical protein